MVRFRSIKRPLRWIWNDRGVRIAFLAFILTRSIILSLFILTAQLALSHAQPSGGSSGTWLSVDQVNLSDIIKKRVTVGDAAWYVGIAAYGYDVQPYIADRQHNWAFFPLFPLLLRYAWRITGEFALTGVALTSLFFLAALVLLHKTALLFGFSTSDADRSVLYLAAFPVSYFFSLPVTESLFLFLTVGCFYAAKRELWWMAGIIGALASATRITGVLLMPAVLLLYWETYRTLRPSWKLLSLLLIPSGLLLFMYLLHSLTGNAFAFRDIATTWGRHPGFFLTPLIDYLRQPLLLAQGWDFRVMNFVAVTNAIVCGAVLLRWAYWSLAMYTLGSLFLTLSSGLLQSQARYAMVLFPVFFILARPGSKSWVHQAILTMSLILLSITVILFCYGVEFTLS